MMENKDRPHVKAGPVKYTKGFRSKMFFSKSVNAMIIILIAVIVIGAILVFMKQPVKTEDGYVVAKPIYEFIENGEKVIVVDDGDFHLFTPLKRFLFTQDAYLAEVIAGPYGKIEQAKDKQRVSDGVDVFSVNLPDIDKEYLDMEYVVREIDSLGNQLESDSDSIVVKENILGGIKVEVDQ